jgi:hypothetical protein
MTEEMDEQNYPIWEKPLEEWVAPVFHQGFEDKKIYSLYNSWYLREGIVPSQEVNFEAYQLTTIEKIKAFFRPKAKVPLAFSYEEMVQKTREKQKEYRQENEILTKKVKSTKKLDKTLEPTGEVVL